MREVEAQPVGRYQRALLRDMIAEHLAQRLVQQMRRGMVGADRRAALMIDVEFDGIARLERSRFDLADVDEEVAEFLLRVGDAEQRTLRPTDHAAIADLAAALAIERRLVERSERLRRRLQRCRLPAA